MSNPKRARKSPPGNARQGTISLRHAPDLNGAECDGDIGALDRLLLQISEHMLLATAPAPMVAQIITKVGQFLGVSRCFFATVDAAHDRFTVDADYHDPGQPSLAGTHALSAFGPKAAGKAVAGEIVVVNDVASDPLTAGYEANYTHFGIRSYTVAPLMRAGRMEAALTVTTSEVHSWSTVEISLISTVAERVWLALEKLRLDAELRDRESQFRTMAGLMPVFIFTAAANGEPEFVNEPFFQYIGFKSRQAAPPAWSDLLHPEDRETSLTQWRESLSAGTVFQGDFRLRAADGSYRWFHGIAHPVSSSNGSGNGNGKGGVARWFGSCADIDDLMRARTALAVANERLEERVTERTSQLATARCRLEQEFEERRRLESEMTALGEKEREALGQDLHDGVCQHLTGVAMMVDTLGDSFRRKSHPEEARRCKEIADLIRKASHHAGTVARSLHPVDVDAKVLPRALQELATHHSTLSGVKSRFICEVELNLENEVAMHLYRIAQEAIQYAIRHAQAKEVTIRLCRSRGAVMLTIADDGQGSPGHEQAAGLGLRVIRCHADALGAALTIDSTVGGGTVVKCTLPQLH
jgi:PAS domain S-box-containing protein